MKKIRESNIELIRILSILGVIILHYNNSSIGKALLYTQNNVLNRNILLLFESMSICAVNLFVLLNGYFMCKNDKRSIGKPVRLIMEVILFSVVFYIINVLIGNTVFSLSELLYHFLPANYFVILYVALYFISPYINKVLNQLDKKEWDQMLIILLLLFSIYPAVVDLFTEVTGITVLGLSTISMYGSQHGYTIVNFILMYIIGAYLRMNEDKYLSKMYCLGTFALCTLGMFVWQYIGLLINKDTSGSAFAYYNPLCIFAAASIFMLFKQIKIKNNVYINYFAKGSFIVFLVHSQFFGYVFIEKYVNQSVVIMLLHLIMSTCLIYIMGIIVFSVYQLFEKMITSLINNKKGQKGA